MAEHRIIYCGLCECWTVVCGTCGNNACNGGSGEVDGKPCPDCDNAYEMAKTVATVKFYAGGWRDTSKNSPAPF